MKLITIAIAALIASSDGKRLRHKQHLRNRVRREPLLSNLPKEPESPYPVDYFVPNFGADRDILATAKHIDDAEVSHSHRLLFAEAEEHPVDYAVPNFGVDRDIQAT